MRSLPLRLGVVDYLNSKPLAWSFLQGDHRDLFDLRLLPPAAVADGLAGGSLEIGLLPSIEAQRIDGIQLIPDLCVAARREVRSVLLVHRRPLKEIRRVALDENSRTSAALVRIVLQDLFGLTPQWAVAPPVVERMLQGHDAALVIGDPALRVDRDAWQVMDLAAAWRRLTGHPFVFAVWAVRSEVEVPDLASYFHHSLRAGMANLEPLVARSARELGLAPAEIRTYLTENLSFRLGEEELAGLEEFHSRARAMGLVDGPRRMEFRRPGGGAGVAPPSTIP